jgi:hypothetical protein
VCAQNDFHAPKFGVIAHGGFVIPHRTVMKGLLQRHAKAFEASVEWHASGKAAWHHYYARPSIGVDLFTNDTGNSDELGYHIALNFFVRAPLGANPKFYQFFKFGLGPGFATKTWHLEDNLRNTTVSSAISGSLLLQYGIKKSILPRLDLLAGVRLSHYSNAGLKQPNLGINTVSLYVGGLIGAEPPELVEYERPDWTEKRIQSSVTFSLGRSDLSPESGRLHTAWILSTLVERRMTNKSKMGLAMDAFYNLAISERLLNDGLDHVDPSANLQLGTAFSYTLIFGPFDLKMMLGVYLKNEMPEVGTIYNRFGLRYHYKNLYASLMAKTHLSKAEYPELGIGYRF